MEVIFFHSTTCPQCRAVERSLKERGIEYVSCSDVKEMLEKGVQHTPTVIVDGQRLQGKAIMDWIKGVRLGD